MITGDNPLTAAAIAAEAGVDDFLAEATPEDKLALIRAEQAGGKPRRDDGRRHERRARARAGRRRRRDEHGDAAGEGGRQHGRPRLRPDQAHRGRRDRQAAAHHARRAHDVLDRERRREVLRDHPGDVRRVYPGSQTLNIMRLASPESAILSAVIFNALIIVALIPLACAACVPARGGGSDPAPEPADLRPRRDRRALRRDQAHRPPRRPPPRTPATHHATRPSARAAVRMVRWPTLLLRPGLPPRHHRRGPRSRTRRRLDRDPRRRVVGSSLLGQAASREPVVPAPARPPRTIPAR